MRDRLRDTRIGDVRILCVTAGIAVSIGAWHAASAGWIGGNVLTLPLFWLGYAAVGIAGAPRLARRFAGHARALPRAPLAILTGITAGLMLRHVLALVGSTPDQATLTIGSTIFQVPTLAYALSVMALLVALVGGPKRGGTVLRALGRDSYDIYLAHVLHVMARLPVLAPFVGSPGPPTTAAR